MKPGDGYIAYIINPKSGSSSIRWTEHQFRSYLVDQGYDVRVSHTKSLQHACEIATDAAVDFECALVVAVGGDGTVREVAHGLEGSDKPLLIVPCGTENLLANELGFDEKLSTLIRTFEGGHTQPLDLGTANEKSFTCVAGFGFDGQIVDTFHKMRDGHVSHMDYLAPIWRTFWQYTFPPITVHLDGEQLYEGPALVFVGNVSRYAIGLEILRSADFGDGLLDICIYKCKSKASLVKHSIKTVFKRHATAKDVIYKQGKKVRISSPSENVLCEIDGDPGPTLPVEIELLPAAINVMVLEGARPAGMRTRIIRALS